MRLLSRVGNLRSKSITANSELERTSDGDGRAGVEWGPCSAGPWWESSFWAVARGGPELPLLVLDLVDHEFVRVVLEMSEPEVTAALIVPDYSPSRDP